MSSKVWRDATLRLARMYEEHQGLSKGVASHTDKFIFPAAVIYLSLKEYAPDEAYDILKVTMKARSERMDCSLAKMTRIPGFKGLQGIANANRGYVRRILDLAFRSTAKSKYNCDHHQPTGYIMKVEPYDKEKGPRYIFERCPITEFAKEHGYLDIMPAFCNSDYPAMDMIHAHLIRRYTCANADICDYRIVGDESEEAKSHPRKTDEKGYWYND